MFETRTVEVKTPITGNPKIDKANEKLARGILSQVINDKDFPKADPNTKIENVSDRKIHDLNVEIEKTKSTVQHKEVDMFTAIKDAVAPFIEIALFGAALVLIGKYIFIVLGVDDPHCRASIIDVWFGIGVVVGLLINDAINLKIDKK